MTKVQEAKEMVGISREEGVGEGVSRKTGGPAQVPWVGQFNAFGKPVSSWGLVRPATGLGFAGV